jgi:hypothetical protein
MPSLKEQRTTARAEMAQNPYITIMVKHITHSGSLKITDHLKAVVTELKENGVNTLLPNDEWHDNWARAKELSKVFKCNMGKRGKVIVQHETHGRPAEDYTDAYIGALDVQKATGYVSSTAKMTSALWECQCDCGADVIKSAHELNYNLPYCNIGESGAILCPHGYAKAKQWRKDKRKAAPRTPTHAQASAAANQIIKNLH